MLSDEEWEKVTNAETRLLMLSTSLDAAARGLPLDADDRQELNEDEEAFSTALEVFKGLSNRSDERDVERRS
jgi:ubiquitin-protein ligase